MSCDNLHTLVKAWEMVSDMKMNSVTHWIDSELYKTDESRSEVKALYDLLVLAA